MGVNNQVIMIGRHYEAQVYEVCFFTILIALFGCENANEGFSKLEEFDAFNNLGEGDNPRPVKIESWEPEDEVVTLGQSESATFSVFLTSGGDKTVAYTFKVGDRELGTSKGSFMNLSGSQFDEGVSSLEVIAENSIGRDSHVFTVKRNTPASAVVRQPIEQQLQLDCTKQFSVFSATFEDLDQDDLTLKWTPNGDELDPNMIVATQPLKSQLIYESSCLQLSTDNTLKLIADDGHDQSEASWIFSVVDPNGSFGGIGNSALVFEPLSVDFGNIQVGSQSDTKVVNVKNDSSVDIFFNQASVANENFEVVYSACPLNPTPLASGASCVMGLRFNPSVSANLGTNVLFTFGPSPAENTDYTSSLAMSGRGVGALNFDGLDEIVDVTHNSLKLVWAPTPEAVSFTIFRVVGTSLEYIETLLNTGGGVFEAAYAGLTPGANYVYRVRASDVFGINDSNTNDVPVSMLPNTAPSLPAIANPVVYAGRLSDPVDVNDTVTGNDTDPDGDNITYSCRFDNVIDGVVSPAASACSSLVNVDASNASFNIYTGLLTNWKPPFSDTGTDFEFRITGSDVYAGTSSSIFSTTILSGEPQINAVSDMIYPSQHIETGTTLSLDISNVRFGSASDDLMSYTCTFVKHETSGPTVSSNCTGLPGTASFNLSTGVFSWLTDASSKGGYTLTFTGTNGGGSSNDTAKIAVSGAYEKSSAVFELRAAHADSHAPGTNDASFLTSWDDLTGTVTSGTLSNFPTTAWAGTGVASDPYVLMFDGVDDHVDFGTDHNNLTTYTFETWIAPGDVSNASQVIFSNGDSSGYGLTVTNSKIMTGGFSSNYEAAVLADSPEIYWRFNNIVGTTVIDLSGNVNNGVMTNTGSIFQQNTTPLSDISDQSMYTTSGSGYVHASDYDIDSDWSIEVWFKYPFPGNCTINNWCTLTRGSGEDHQIIVSNSLQLGTYVNSGGGFLYSGFNMSSLSDGWHHLVAVADAGTTTFYIDGAVVGSSAGASSSNIRSVGSHFSGQPFGYFDEFAFYDVPLSPAQIQAHYNAATNFDSCDHTLLPDYWYNLAAVIDEPGATVDAYLNGMQYCSFSITNAPGISGSVEPLLFGRTYQGSTQSWQGKLSEFMIHNVADDTIITSNFAGKSPDYEPLVPIPLNGLKLWLDAGAATFQDTGATVVANDGDPVAFWDDLSGNAGAVSQTTGTRAGTLRTNVLNGHPVVEFDGTEDRLENTVNYGVPSTVIYVGRILGANRRRVLGGRSNNWLLGYHSGYKNRFYGQGWLHQPNTAVVDNEWNLFVGQINAGLFARLYTNGNQQAANTGPTQGPNGISVGGSSNQWSYSQAAEVIIYDRVLTDPEREAIEAYLNEKYSIY